MLGACELIHIVECEKQKKTAVITQKIVLTTTQTLAAQAPLLQ